MSNVAASILVNAPSDFTVAFLNTYIQDHVRSSSGPHLQLHLPFQHLAGTAALKVDVTVHVTYLPKRRGKPPRLSIAWNPASRIFPSFRGTIAAVSREGDDCTLTIRGVYKAPFGIAGAFLDAVIGIRIAHATLQELLQEFRDAIEVDYRERMKWD